MQPILQADVLECPHDRKAQHRYTGLTNCSGPLLTASSPAGRVHQTRLRHDACHRHTLLHHTVPIHQQAITSPGRSAIPRRRLHWHWRHQPRLRLRPLIGSSDACIDRMHAPPMLHRTHIRLPCIIPIPVHCKVPGFVHMCMHVTLCTPATCRLAVTPAFAPPVHGMLCWMEHGRTVRMLRLPRIRTSHHARGTHGWWSCRYPIARGPREGWIHLTTGARKGLPTHGASAWLDTGICMARTCRCALSHATRYTIVARGTSRRVRGIKPAGPPGLH